MATRPVKQSGDATSQPAADAFDPDNEKFLHRVKRRGREDLVSHCLRRVNDDFNAFFEENISSGWEGQHLRICEHFGLRPPTDLSATLTGGAGLSKGASTFNARSTMASGLRGGESIAMDGRKSVLGRSTMGKSVIGVPDARFSVDQIFGDAPDDEQQAILSDTRHLREKSVNFALKVAQLNEARLQEKPYPILHEFAEVEKLGGGDVSFMPRLPSSSYIILLIAVITNHMSSRYLLIWLKLTMR